MKWNVEFTKKAAKQVAVLSKRTQAALRLLVEDIQENGAAQPTWPNYSKLKQGKGIDKYHCHLYPRYFKMLISDLFFYARVML
ncbi:MAG: hypothetical protein HKM04_05985 [Legionellales bacterium]|nr:hypothetical protein [Legionellales bacterium]